YCLARIAADAHPEQVPLASPPSLAGLILILDSDRRTPRRTLLRARPLHEMLRQVYEHRRLRIGRIASRYRFSGITADADVRSERNLTEEVHVHHLRRAPAAAIAEHVDA